MKHPRSRFFTRCAATCLLLGTIAQIGVCSAQEDDTGTDASQVVYQIAPSATDPAISHFDDPHYVIFDRSAGPAAQLVVFMPGTGGKPGNSARFFKVIASQGYRVMGLEYNDVPAVAQVCPNNPDPQCSGEFRRMRVFADIRRSVVENPPAESIVNRLVKLLEYLDRQHPQEGWKDFLAAGEPNWSRIVISGLSQGAGMAAYIAKHEPVARVVLFSSPWDCFSRSRILAPWIREPGVTPPERWFAEFHRRENTAELIVRAYEALRIPRSNVLVFDLDIPPRMHNSHSDNPFHASTIRVPAYEPQWRILFGHSP